MGGNPVFHHQPGQVGMGPNLVMQQLTQPGQGVSLGGQMGTVTGVWGGIPGGERGPVTPSLSGAWGSVSSKKKRGRVRRGGKRKPSKNITDVRILHSNIRGYKSKNLKLKPLDVICLNETGLKGSNKVKLDGFFLSAIIELIKSWEGFQLLWERS